MKISGFTIVKNAVKMGYPFRESILSILPVCDEFIINVGQSEDDTLAQIQALDSPKIVILNTVWDDQMRAGGKVLSTQTNIALRACTGDWAFYLQSDEVMHEKYLNYLQLQMQRYLNRPGIEGLMFNYRHFYGSYDYYQDNFRRWYPREVRIVRCRENIISWGDAMDFRHPDGSKLKSAWLNAEVYHYGWVKPPQQMLYKKRTLDQYWHDDQWIETQYQSKTEFEYPDRNFLVKFKGTHPAVMRDRVLNYHYPFTVPRTWFRCYFVRKLAVFLEPLLKRLKKL